MRDIHVGVSVVIRRDESVLLVQERKPGAYGKWNLPGGHLEQGEGLVDGARREVEEETGLVVEPDGLLGVYPRTADSGVHLIGFVFLAACSEGDVCASEDVLDVKWYGMDEVLGMRDDEVLGAARLRRIVEDVRAGNRYPLEVISC